MLSLDLLAFGLRLTPPASTPIAAEAPTPYYSSYPCTPHLKSSSNSCYEIIFRWHLRFRTAWAAAAAESTNRRRGRRGGSGGLWRSG